MVNVWRRKEKAARVCATFTLEAIASDDCGLVPRDARSRVLRVVPAVVQEGLFSRQDSLQRYKRTRCGHCCSTGKVWLAVAIGIFWSCVWSKVRALFMDACLACHLNAVRCRRKGAGVRAVNE